jgi:hypothetical protein
MVLVAQSTCPNYHHLLLKPLLLPALRPPSATATVLHAQWQQITCVLLAVLPLTHLLLTPAASVRFAIFSNATATVPHAQWQQITCVLLAVVAAISMGNAAGGSPRQPAALAQLLRAQELTSHLQKSEF